MKIASGREMAGRSDEGEASGSRSKGIRMLNEHFPIKVKDVKGAMDLVSERQRQASAFKDNKFIPSKILDIVDILSPYPYRSYQDDNIDKINQETSDSIEALNRETEKLHEKIIEIDAELDESELVLESLLNHNKELQAELESLQKKSKYDKDLINDFESIDSEDLNCLKRLRMLVQQKIRLKYNIRELEEREKVIREQLNQLPLIVDEYFKKPHQQSDSNNKQKKMKYEIFNSGNKIKSKTRNSCQCSKLADDIISEIDGKNINDEN